MKLFFCILTDISTIAVFYGLMFFSVIFWGKYPVIWAAPFIAVKDIGFPWPGWLQYSFLAAFGISVFVPVLNPFREKFGSYGAARWAGKKDIKKMGLFADQGLILGVKGRHYIRTDEPLSVLVKAPPGSGKTAGIIIPCLVSCGNSAVIHDPKGELYLKTHRRRKHFSRIIKFSPGDKDSMRWNPLSKEELPEDWADIQIHVGRISQTAIPENPRNPGDHWPAAARDLFMFWALYLVYRDGETSLPAILKEPLKTDDIQAKIAKILDEDENLPERIRLTGNGILGKPRIEFGSIVSTFQTHLNVFFDDRVQNNLTGSDFSVMDLRKECTSIYFTIKNADQTRLKTLVALFFETVTFAMLDHEPGPEEYRVTAYLDEFVRMSRLKELIEMPAIGRSYKFNAVFVCQSASQIIDIYGQAGLDQLKNTCAYHIFFTQNEQKVAEDISKSLGNKTRSRISTSSGGKTFFLNRNISKEGVPLILPQEIMSLPKNTIIIGVQNRFETPVKARIAFWFKDSALKKHVDDTEIPEDDIEITEEKEENYENNIS